MKAMSHNEMVRRVVDARMESMSAEQKLKALRSYMTYDYKQCYTEELEEFYKKYTNS